MRVLIAAGGTGGHIVPALAVAAALEERRAAARNEILFVGSGKEIENRLIRGAGYNLKQVPSLPFLGKGFAGVREFCRAFPNALRLTGDIFNEHRTDVVITFGGYPSMAPAVAARLRHIPLVLQEQNAQVGLANKLLSLFANRIFAVPGAKGFLWKRAVIYQPNPVRKEFRKISPSRPPLSGEKLRLMVMGGSQGAVTMNSAVLSAIPLMKSFDLSVFHQTGEVDFERVSAAYRDAGFENVEVVPFTDKIVEQYEKAHLIVARAGAMSVWEICASGRPAIFIPLRIARAHQSENAKHLVASGAALMIEQEPGFEITFQQELERLLRDGAVLGKMAVQMREESKTGQEAPADVIARVLTELVNVPRSSGAR